MIFPAGRARSFETYFEHLPSEPSSLLYDQCRENIGWACFHATKNTWIKHKGALTRIELCARVRGWKAGCGCGCLGMCACVRVGGCLCVRAVGASLLCWAAHRWWCVRFAPLVLLCCFAGCGPSLGMGGVAHVTLVRLIAEWSCLLSIFLQHCTVLRLAQAWPQASPNMASSGQTLSPTSCSGHRKVIRQGLVDTDHIYGILEVMFALVLGHALPGDLTGLSVPGATRRRQRPSCPH